MAGRQLPRRSTGLLHSCLRMPQATAAGAFHNPCSTLTFEGVAHLHGALALLGAKFDLRLGSVLCERGLQDFDVHRGHIDRTSLGQVFFQCRFQFLLARFFGCWSALGSGPAAAAAQAHQEKETEGEKGLHHGATVAEPSTPVKDFRQGAASSPQEPGPSAENS